MDKKEIQKEFELKDGKKVSKDFNLSGSALMFTMFILSGMLIVAMSGAYIILSGIIAGGIQSQSTKSYFAAEAGAERILWDFRKKGRTYNPDTKDSGEYISEDTLPGGTFYKIYHTSDVDSSVRNNYSSVGTFGNISRSVEVSF